MIGIFWFRNFISGRMIKGSFDRHFPRLNLYFTGQTRTTMPDSRVRMNLFRILLLSCGRLFVQWCVRKWHSWRTMQCRFITSCHIWFGVSILMKSVWRACPYLGNLLYHPTSPPKQSSRHVGPSTSGLWGISSGGISPVSGCSGGFSSFSDGTAAGVVVTSVIFVLSVFAISFIFLFFNKYISFMSLFVGYCPVYRRLVYCCDLSITFSNFVLCIISINYPLNN